MATLLNLGPHRHEVTLGEHGHQIELIERSGHTARFICDALMDSAALLPDGARLHFSGRGQAREVLDTSRAASARKAGAGATDGKLRASMNGRVVALQVHLGQRVSVGQPVLTLEAMEMEHVHVATVAGRVRCVHAPVGDQVPAGRVLVEIDAEITIEKKPPSGSNLPSQEPGRQKRSKRNGWGESPLGVCRAFTPTAK